MINRLLIAGLLSVVSVGVCADYMFELDGSVGSGEISKEYEYSYDEEHDTDTTDFSAKIYFGKVSTNGVPIRESGFLSKKSSINLSRNKNTLDYYNYYFCCRSSDNYRTEMRFGQRFVLPSPSIILGFGYVKGEIESSDLGGMDLAGYNVEVGLYVSDTSAFWLSYEDAELDVDYYRDIDESTIKATYKHVVQLGSSNYLSWLVELEQVENFHMLHGVGERSSIGGSVVWYLNPKLSFGAGLRLDSHDFDAYGDAAGAVFTPRVSYDLNENIGFYAKIRSEAMTIEIDGFYDEDIDISDFSTTIGITARF